VQNFIETGMSSIFFRYGAGIVVGKFGPGRYFGVGKWIFFLKIVVTLPVWDLLFFRRRGKMEKGVIP